MKECIFCKIIKGELPSKTIYEDNQIKIIMNINPITDGHLLVLPINHSTNILDTDKSIWIHTVDIINKKIYPLLKEKLNCEGLTISQNNELGQEIKHFHIHLIPRYPEDKIDFSPTSNLSEVDNIFEKLTK